MHPTTHLLLPPSRPPPQISTTTTAINAHFDRHSGPDAFPHAGTWMMGYGVVHASGFKFELMLRHNTEYNVVAGAWALLPTASSVGRRGCRLPVVSLVRCTVCPLLRSDHSRFLSRQVGCSFE